jgi:hypothetical protein
MISDTRVVAISAWLSIDASASRLTTLVAMVIARNPRLRETINTTRLISITIRLAIVTAVSLFLNF